MIKRRVLRENVAERKKSKEEIRKRTEEFEKFHKLAGIGNLYWLS